jgi:hypothetical protein
MNYPYYHFESSDSLSFYFESVSKTTIIPKVVVFTPIFEDAEIYYLGFGDIQKNGMVDDLKVSNNLDFEKVLATVIEIVLAFFETHHTKKVFFEGSTKPRTRLYQIIINRDLELITQRFNVEGLTEFGFEKYVKNKNYDGFLIELIKKETV